MPSFEDYPKPAIAVDIIALYGQGSTLSVPLVRRGNEPFKGSWALPGGFLDLDETLLEAARREFGEETGLESGELLSGPIFDAVDRDPRGRVISVPHVALISDRPPPGRAGSDAADLRAFPLDELPPNLAFDHAEILRSMRGFAAEQLRLGRLGGALKSTERDRLLDQLVDRAR